MGLYLAVFDDDEEELEGVEVGSYSDWNRFVDKVSDVFEGGVRGSRFPLLTYHSDCEGEWSATDCLPLIKNLDEIAVAFRKLPPEPITEGWQPQVAKEFGLRLDHLYDCFFDVDGENLFERLLTLAETARKTGFPVLFQ
jgi:hypothetical protein